MNVPVNSHRQLIKARKETELVAESVALIALEVDYTIALDHTEGVGGQAKSDVVRERVIAAGRALAEAEFSDASLWSRVEWRDLCCDIAHLISLGMEPNVRAMLKEAAQ